MIIGALIGAATVAALSFGAGVCLKAKVTPHASTWVLFTASGAIIGNFFG